MNRRFFLHNSGLMGLSLALAGTMCTTVVAANNRPSGMTEPDPVGTIYDTADNPFFIPDGVSVGDTFPFYDNGVWHMYYLGKHTDKNRTLRIEHLTSRDLVRWEKRPTSISAPLQVATGCVVRKGDLYYMFYTDHKKQDICLATSSDLDHWTPHAGNPILDGDDKIYTRNRFRDPFVFYNEEDKCWWLLAGSATVDRVESKSFAGCVALAKSDDLINWKLSEPLFEPQHGFCADCPQIIKAGNRWYLFYLRRSILYRIADSSAGPWLRPPKWEAVPRLAAGASRPETDGNRWITWGWVCGGPDSTFSVPRQLDFHADGLITHRPAPELIQAIHDKTSRTVPFSGARRMAGDWKISGSSVECTSDLGGALLLDRRLDNFYFEADVELSTSNMELNFVVHCSDDLYKGYRIVLMPAEHAFFIRFAGCGGRILESGTIDLDASKTFKVRIFLCGGMMEVFVGDKTSLTTRLTKHPEGKFGIQCYDGQTTISNILIRRLGKSE